MFLGSSHWKVRLVRDCWLAVGRSGFPGGSRHVVDVDCYCGGVGAFVAVRHSERQRVGGCGLVVVVVVACSDLSGFRVHREGPGVAPGDGVGEAVVVVVGGPDRCSGVGALLGILRQRAAGGGGCEGGGLVGQGGDGGELRPLAPALGVLRPHLEVVGLPVLQALHCQAEAAAGVLGLMGGCVGAGPIPQFVAGDGGSARVRGSRPGGGGLVSTGFAEGWRAMGFDRGLLDRP